MVVVVVVGTQDQRERLVEQLEEVERAGFTDLLEGLLLISPTPLDLPQVLTMPALVALLRTL